MSHSERAIRHSRVYVEGCVEHVMCPKHVHTYTQYTYIFICTLDTNTHLHSIKAYSNYGYVITLQANVQMQDCRLSVECSVVQTSRPAGRNITTEEKEHETRSWAGQRFGT